MVPGDSFCGDIPACNAWHAKLGRGVPSNIREVAKSVQHRFENSQEVLAQDLFDFVGLETAPQHCFGEFGQFVGSLNHGEHTCGEAIEIAADAHMLHAHQVGDVSDLIHNLIDTGGALGDEFVEERNP